VKGDQHYARWRWPQPHPVTGKKSLYLAPVNPKRESAGVGNTVDQERIRAQMIEGLKAGTLQGVLVITDQVDVELHTHDGSYELPRDTDFFVIALPRGQRPPKVAWLPVQAQEGGA